MRIGSRNSFCVMALFVVAAGMGACSGEEFPTPGDDSGTPGASGSPGVPPQGGAPGTAGGMPGVAGQFMNSGDSGAAAAGSPGSSGSPMSFPSGGSGPGPGPTGPGGSPGGSGSPGVSGSGSGSSGAPGTTVAFSAVAPIIGTRCATIGCHSPGATMPNLSNDANLYQTLTTRMTTKCGGDMLVAKSDPANSALVNMIMKNCGGPFVMPLTCTTPPCVPQAELTTITSWIQAGAPQ